VRPIRRIRLGRAPNCSSLGNVVNVLLWSQAAVGALWVAAEAWSAPRRRPEADGGETAAVDDPPALVSTSPDNSAPHEAHVQVTRACALPCPSCHVDPEPSGAHVPLAEVEARFRSLADRGVFHVAVGGGEALAHPQLAAIATAAHDAGLSIGLTTSGLGELDAAAAFDQVNVSLDALGDGFVRARGYAGAPRALAAIARLAAGGRRVGVNLVLDRDTFGSLAETVAAAVAAGARDVHLLRLKPTGRAVATYRERRLLPEQALAVWPAIVALAAAHPDVSFRVDCAMTPFLAAHGVSPDRMAAFGWTGCHGGDALLAVDTRGAESPCSFVAGPPDPAWRVGVREGACGACPWQALCRGGCHAVARHLTGELLAPDPECPRVIAAAASGPA
jgi:radical SAM protein with 4Fe4S-binding SPASM domain